VDQWIPAFPVEVDPSNAAGDIRVSGDAIRVVLSPAARDDERDAFAALCGAINGWDLVLPGDPRRRPMRFQAQL
jgi:hypothetical protein